MPARQILSHIHEVARRLHRPHRQAYRPSEYLRTVQRGDIGLLSPWGGRSLDDRFWLTIFMDGGPTCYYVYDRTARRATFLFTDNQALDAYTLGRRRSKIITRDGLELPADLYLPKNADPDGNGRPRRPLPLLIYVHGGPWAAYPWNDWYTNRTLQLLADRGYAALRVEFRAANRLGEKSVKRGRANGAAGCRTI